MLTETEKAMSSSELRYLIAAQALAQKKPVVKQTDIVNQLRVTKVSAPGTALRTKTWTGRKEGIIYTREQKEKALAIILPQKLQGV